MGVQERTGAPPSMYELKLFADTVRWLGPLFGAFRSARRYSFTCTLEAAARGALPAW